MIAHLRITRYATASPADLTPHPLNARLHTTPQRAALTALLDSVGWVRRVLVNEQTGHILNGHLRVEEAKASGQERIPVAYTDLDEREERLVLGLFDALGEMALADVETLTELLDQAQVHAEPLQVLLATLALEVGIGLELDDGKTPDETPPEPANVTGKFGELRLHIERDLFERWRETLYQAVGFDESAIVGEIQRRLGL